MHRGSCLCGAVRFTVEGELRGPDACHCGKCRKHSGHYFVSTDVPRSAVTIEGKDKISWFQSSEKARRGFCSVCGSSLFWDPLQRDWIGIAMGAFDTPTHTRVAVHVYMADKGDYYDVADGVPQFDTIPPKPH
ncbi:GFA family protein [Corallococcus llansteffanensis]|uniref:GFA family protein n=1 Tax=Corallococcus llansteffanensis TaxID=2316731 RepID=A0A3A8PAH1_9BACT|nr:GFA family protein [Corallococcus llansteffanensis]RKH52300.1 GFA family protein [Corallococcus llansteffanensis]